MSSSASSPKESTALSKQKTKQDPSVPSETCDGECPLLHFSGPRTTWGPPILLTACFLLSNAFSSGSF